MVKRTVVKAGEETRPRLKSWSYSTYTQYEGCPARVYYGKILKLPDPLGPAVERGNQIHVLADRYLKGILQEFPAKGVGKEWHAYREHLDALKDLSRMKSESDMTFTREWRKTHWRDWDGAWVRMKLDVEAFHSKTHLLVVDFKSGQDRDYSKQLELYGLGGFKQYPSVKEVTAEIWLVDQPNSPNAIRGINFTRATDEKRLQTTWEGRVEKMMADETYKARPSRACSWCPFSKAKGGPCTEA